VDERSTVTRSSGGQPDPSGRTWIAADAARYARAGNFRGRPLAIVMGTVGKRVLGKALENTVKAIEARA
jgi:hypothetical protein